MLLKCIGLSILLAMVATSAFAQEPPEPSEIEAADPPAAAAPAAPTAKGTAKANSNYKLTDQDIAKKQRQLDEKIALYRSRVDEGGGILKKWESLSQVYQKYGEESQGAELECEVAKNRFEQAKARNLSDFIKTELAEKVKDCEQEVVRSAALRKAYDRQLSAISEAVDRVNEEVKITGERADQELAKKKRLNLEQQVKDSFDDAMKALKKFDPANKNIPMN